MGTYRDGLEDAAKIADMWAEENFRLAGDTILHDPVLSGRDRSQSGFIASQDFQRDGFGHASRAHTAQDIATAIRERLKP